MSINRQTGPTYKVAALLENKEILINVNPPIYCKDLEKINKLKI